jgi:pimeloyl-ACP methyl ester carboxylesterase
MTGPTSWTRLAAAVAAALLVAACSPDDEPTSGSSIPTRTEAVATTSAVVEPGGEPTQAPVVDSTAAVTPVFEPAPIEWEPFNEAVDVGTLEVPVDYAKPDGERFELFLARYNALDQENKIGTLLVNPGGPGFGGTGLALNASLQFDEPLRQRFDIIGWDPRGTAESDPPIDCVDSFDPYFTGVDSTPVDDAERAAAVALAEQFANACIERTGSVLPYVGTNNSARDIDTIRRALGEETISFFGLSYGSELGTTWATLFPDTVRALVADGAVDPNADGIDSNIQQLQGFEASLTAFLDQCAADDECAFQNDGDAAAAFDDLMASVDAAPIMGAPDRPPVNRDIARTGVARALYSEDLWPTLAESLAAAQAGDGSGLLALFDAYYRREADGTWGNELEAFQVIDCMDRPDRPTVAQADAEMAALIAAAPRFVPPGSVADYGCTFFPPAIDPRVPITGAGAGPIVVIGTTGDSATPLASTRGMADALEDGRLVVVTANEHTGYGQNQCVIDVVNAYLIDLRPPDAETTCE